MNRLDAELTATHVPKLALARLGETDEAGLVMTSLPWPAVAPYPLTLDDRPTHCQSLGQWPAAHGHAPRRLLLTADGAGGAPATLSLRQGVTLAAAKPTASIVCFRHCEEDGFMWENHCLELRYGGRSMCLALGLKRATETTWWEGCGLEVLEDSPWCTTVKMGGAIPHTLISGQELFSVPTFKCPWLHRHNWLNGELIVRLFGNGVVDVMARHINSKQVDAGHALDDCLPLLGIWGDGVAADAKPLLGNWTGDNTRLRFGPAAYDLSHAAHLVSARHPGRFDLDDEDRLLWQPYQSVAIYGGGPTREQTGDPWIVSPAAKRFPRGMARTVRFSLSLSDRSPRIVRYLAPAGWYGACREFHASPWLPVSDALDGRLTQSADWAVRTMARGSFEDGCLPRSSPADRQWDAEHRDEPGWEGDTPHAVMLGAYRFGNADYYDTALRAAYFVTDCVIDHADKLFRMQGFTYPPVAYALPMNRPLCAITAWLETGDPYLLDTAEAVVEAANRIHLNSWPRLAVGRDSCFLRGAVALYRYCGSDYFRRIAKRGCLAVANVQRANGSFGDQGGGAGIHQWGAYITKPWMGCLATSPLLDLLELEPDLPEHHELATCVRRFADWLMANRWERQGIHSWSYQHAFKDKPDFYDIPSSTWVELRNPGQWHHDQLARLLMWTTLATGDTAYAHAWYRSVSTAAENHCDHRASATLMFQPYLQAALWRVRLTADGPQPTPIDMGDHPAAASVLLPDGSLQPLAGDALLTHPT